MLPKFTQGFIYGTVTSLILMWVMREKYFAIGFALAGIFAAIGQHIHNKEIEKKC